MHLLLKKYVYSIWFAYIHHTAITVSFFPLKYYFYYLIIYIRLHRGPSSTCNSYNMGIPFQTSSTYQHFFVLRVCWGGGGGVEEGGRQRGRRETLNLPL